MMTCPELSFSGPRSGSLYRLRMDGYLDESFLDFVDEATLSVTTEPGHGAVTELTCWLRDEATLVGLINTLYDFGLRILSVECLSAGTK